MKKEEKSFRQLLDEVIQQAKTEGRTATANPSKKEIHIDISANIADEWGFASGRSSSQQIGNRK
ncbi:MAG: hypothetical protein ABI772_08550 [Bacteroidota bacterium]